MSIVHTLLGPAALAKGKQLCESNHVFDVKEIRSGTDCNISAAVIRQASVTLEPYIVKLEIGSSTDRQVVKAFCPCPAGIAGVCKHVAAVVHFVNAEESFSKTSKAQEWGKPSTKEAGKRKYAKGRRVCDLIPQKKPKSLHQPIQICAQNLPHCSLAYILQHEEKTEVERTTAAVLNDLITSCCDIVSKEEASMAITFILQSQKKQRIFQNIQYNNKNLAEDKVTEICLSTVDQSKCSRWFQERKMRISASAKAHRIKVRRKEFEVLATQLLKDTPLRGIALQNAEYGNQNEDVARQQYGKLTGTKVLPCGLVIHQIQGWLCASPDGIVLENGNITRVLEIKCPSSCKNMDILNENGKPNLKYLEVINNKLSLKRSHQYFTQVQVLMYCTGIATCDLMIYNSNKSHIITIARDDNFLEACILKLETFYFTHYIPQLESVK